MLVAIAPLWPPLEIHPLGEPIDDLSKDKSHQWPQPDLVARRDDQVKRYRMLEIDEIVDPEITRGGVANDQRITVKSQRRLCSGEHAAEILVLLVEHLPNFLRHHWVRRGSLAIRRTPTQLVLGIVREILQLGKRFFETHVGVGEDAGKVGKTCGFSRLRGS